MASAAAGAVRCFFTKAAKLQVVILNSFFLLDSFYKSLTNSILIELLGPKFVWSRLNSFSISVPVIAPARPLKHRASVRGLVPLKAQSDACLQGLVPCRHVAQAEGLGPVRACDVDVVGNLSMVGMPAVGQG